MYILILRKYLFMLAKANLKQLYYQKLKNFICSKEKNVYEQKVTIKNKVLSDTENHYREDGSIYIPEALRPYMGGKDKISPRGRN